MVRYRITIDADIDGDVEHDVVSNALRAIIMIRVLEINYSRRPFINIGMASAPEGYSFRHIQEPTMYTNYQPTQVIRNDPTS